MYVQFMSSVEGVVFQQGFSILQQEKKLALRGNLQMEKYLNSNSISWK